MKVFSPIIILTLVVFSLVRPSVGWGADEKTNDCSVLEGNLKTAQDNFRKDPENDYLHSEYDKANRKYDECRNDIKSEKTDLREQCKTWKQEQSDILKDFDTASQVAARVCLHANEDEEPEYTRALLTAMVTQTVAGSKQCDIEGAKTSRAKKREDIDKENKDLDKEIRKADSDLMKKEKSYQEELESINEDRKKLKEEWENAQEDAEDAQTKALSKLRDNQLQLADNIRKLQTAAITARQNVQSIDIEIKAALNTAKAPNGKVVNLRNENAIHNHCVAVAKAARKETGASGMSKNAASGTQQVKTLRAAYDTCITELHELRQTVYQSFSNSAEQRIKQQQDIAQQLSEAEASYSKLTENYNKMLEQLKTKLSKGLQRYMEKDNDLANKYNQTLQRAAQERQMAIAHKMQDQQTMMANYTSQGKLSKQDARQISAQAERLYAIEDNMKQKCPAYQDMRLSKDIVDSDYTAITEEDDSGGQR